MGRGGCNPVANWPAKNPEAAELTTLAAATKISAALLATKCTPDECWIVHRGVVYDATAWLAKHPGGSRTILSNSGRDATAVLLAMHDAKVLEGSLRRMRRVGILVEEPASDETFEEEKKQDDDLDSGVVGLRKSTMAWRKLREAAIERDFLLLEERLAREGWYEPGPRAYWVAVLRALVILCVGLRLILWGAEASTFGAVVLGSVFLGLFFQQVAFFGHDAGHGSITGHFSSDEVIGLLVGNTLAGIDIHWWKSTHNVHHGATNSIHDDPDIQHLPLFCFEEDMVHSAEETGVGQEVGLWSTYHGRFMSASDIARSMMQYQHLYYFPVMAFARINLYIQSIIHLARTCPFRTSAGTSPVKANSGGDQTKTPYEWGHAKPALWTAQVFCLCVNYSLWYMLLSSLDATSAWTCYLVSHWVAGILHVQILLSHVAMHYHNHSARDGVDDNSASPEHEVGVGFHELQALTTMDIACHPSLDWFHGGLQFQLEHHLYPRVPKFKLRGLIPLVDAIFAKHGVPVVRKGFFEGNVMVLRHMARVGKNISRIKRD